MHGTLQTGEIDTISVAADSRQSVPALPVSTAPEKEPDSH